MPWGRWYAKQTTYGGSFNIELDCYFIVRYTSGAVNLKLSRTKRLVDWALAFMKPYGGITTNRCLAVVSRSHHLKWCGGCDYRKCSGIDV
jgi:hypothetical protein